MKTTIRIFCLLLCWSSATSAADIFLVRHAEKQTDGTRDPGLTQTGLKRAADLAVLLRDTDISKVYSSDYRRTRLTAAPVALQAGVEMEIYLPAEPESLLNVLRASPENSLVVGHSNTIPQLARLLGVTRAADLAEWQYDTVYLLHLEHGVLTHSLLLHLPPASIAPE